MNKKLYPIIDVAKFISAILVVAIHTGPFLDISKDFNTFYVQVIGRMAVPFFFVASGFLLFRHFDLDRSIHDPDNVRNLRNYIQRIFKLYVVWTLIYLPLSLYGWYKADFDMLYLLRYIRDFFFNGSYYHLWFLPSLMFGACLVYYLIFRFGIRNTCLSVFAIYMLGMMVNLYQPVLNDIPFLSVFMEAYLSVFYTTRNGLFFGSMYIFLGAAITYADVRLNRRQSGIAFMISLPLLMLEVYLIQLNGFMHSLASMYLMLAPTVFFLFQYLITFDIENHLVYKTMRQTSLLMYVSHIIFVFLLELVLPDANSLLLYAAVIGMSILFSLIVLALSKKLPKLKEIY